MVSEGRCGMAPIAGEYNFKLRRYGASPERYWTAAQTAARPKRRQGQAIPRSRLN
jgi:hypothetical protein